MIIGITFAVSVVLLFTGIIYAKQMQASSMHDIYPQDKFEEEEELPQPKGKVNQIDIESENDKRKDADEPVDFTKKDIIPLSEKQAEQVEESQEALVSKDQSK